MSTDHRSPRPGAASAPQADLRDQHCRVDPPRCSPAQIEARLRSLQRGWQVDATGSSLCREIGFDDYLSAVSFANVIAWIAHRQDHHPHLGIDYDRVSVSYTTHSAGGLTDNDFICAARIDAQLDMARADATSADSS
ncbi:MAG: 4a-hydroxytetrahydrobiopterin dehydratase [Gammaproteobacteria bacterium]|nr:4a-hydroxytetrahydrobiopterin dehydratase [Gammaproteobacteria bacterium]